MEILDPIFREIFSTLEGNCTFNDIKEIKDCIIDIIVSNKNEMLENKPNIQVDIKNFKTKNVKD